MAISVQSRRTIEAQIIADIGAAVDADDMQRTFDLASMALARGIAHPVVFNARGLAFQSAGRHEQALEDFRRALNVTPRDPMLLNALAISLMALERYPQARETLDKAIALSPNHAYSHYRRGIVLAMLGNHDAAAEAYRRVLELDPQHGHALGNLASIAARKGRAGEARALADRALQLVPNEPMALNALATLDISEKRYTDAEQRLRRLLASSSLNRMNRAGILAVMGDALDGQGRYAEAFEIYREQNNDLRRASVHQIADGRGADATRHIATYFEQTGPGRWIPPDDGGQRPHGLKGHVFLLGFMRSGTTLLEQVLASHPDIVALEEKGTLNRISEPYLTSNEGLDALANLSGPVLDKARAEYWKLVRDQNIELSGKVFVDKQPLNTIKLPVIAKLFPGAKILFALRDPRDVVFSCFRRHFRVNATMFEFLDLEDAATFYASVMRLAELYRQKLQVNLLEHKYEDMVQDFEGRVKAVCGFIGVEWTDSMRDFNKLAPAVDLRSPSATQVRKPLYGEAVAQWRSYKEQLSPIFPILAPWVEKFGYPPN